MNQVVCENPKFIVNPSLGQLLAKYHNYYLNGKACYYKYTSRALFRLNMRPFYECLDSVNHDTIDNYFVIDKDSGETFNIFLEVPCGHCAICKVRKQNSFVQRCRLESQLYDSYPWFFTLTYNDNNLPFDGVSVRDVQLFMKRFRINLQRAGYFKPIRYVIVSEYGKHTHRAHYHGIIWNLAPNIFNDYNKLQDILCDSWGLGFVRPRLIDPRDDKSFRYTSKYMRKDCVVPDGCNEPFMLYSRKGGAIGAPFLDGIKSKVVSRLNTKFQFLDKWTQKTVPLRFDGYVLNRLFPSFCKTIPSSLRMSASRFMYHFSCLSLTDPTLTFLYQSTYDSIISNFDPRLYWTCNQFECHCIDLRSDSRTIGILEDCSRKLQPFFGRTFDFDQAQENQKKRDLFLSKCFRDLSPVDIDALGYSCRQSLSRSRAIEQL